MKALPPLLWMLAALPAAYAQDDSLPPDDRANEPPAAQPMPEDDARSLLATAFRRYKNAEHLFVRTSVRHEAAPGKGQMFGGRVVTSFGGAAPAFEGEVEGWRGPNGVTILTSRQALPGFAMYVAKGRTVKEITYEDGQTSLAQLKAELAPLLDTERFTRKLFDAKFHHSRDAETGDLTFHGELPREIVKATRAPGPMPVAAKVLKTHGKMVVDKEGRFKRIEVKVTRNDPMAEMMRGGGFRVVVGGGGGQAPKNDEDDEKHDIEGGTTTYSLTFHDDGPSERAKAFKARIEKLTAE